MLLDRVAIKSAVVDFFSFLLVLPSVLPEVMLYYYFIMIQQSTGHVQVQHLAFSMYDSFYFCDRYPSVLTSNNANDI